MRTFMIVHLILATGSTGLGYGMLLIHIREQKTLLILSGFILVVCGYMLGFILVLMSWLEHTATRMWGL